MTQHTYCGVTFSLITGDGLGERIDRIQDLWGPDWRDDPVKRLVMETFNECEHFIDHYEDAARMRAARPFPAYKDCNYPWMHAEGCKCAASSSPSPIDHSEAQPRHNGQSETASAVHAKAMHKLAANLICPPAADDEPERLRKAGAL